MAGIVHSVGPFTIMTEELGGRPDKFVTMVMITEGAVPWDAHISENAEEATEIHNRFCIMCDLFAPVMAQDGGAVKREDLN